MGFVKSPEEIARIQAVLAEPRFLSAEVVTVEFLTRPDIVKSVLPPGLQPAAEPIATATIGRWGRSNCVHAFAGGSLNVRAQHGELVGDYCLAMPMSTDRALIFGRELFGEPKKLADTLLECLGTSVRGRCVRYGRPIIEIEVDLDREVPPGESRRNVFHYKFLPRSDGRGLEADPVLVLASFDIKQRRVVTGRGRLRLGRTAHDPLGDIEIVETRGGSYVESDIAGRARSLTTVPAEAFLPYAYGKVDNWTRLDNEGDAPWGDVRVDEA